MLVVVVVLVLVVVVFGAVLVCVVVTGGVRRVEVDFVVVVVTGATWVTGAVVVTTGAAVVTAAVAVVVVELWVTEGFLRWAFLWCAGRFCGAAAADDVVLDVVVEVELVEAADEDEALGPPELPQPAIATPVISASSTAFIRPTPLIARRLVPKANNG